MLQIGSGWHKINKENGNNSISISVSKEFTKLFPQFDGLFFGLYENKNKTDEKHPDYFFYLSAPEENKTEKKF